MYAPAKKLRRVFVWQLPVRLFHWVNALAIVILGVTGYIIGNPPALMSSTEASNQYWFGTLRFIHFVTAYIFFFNFVFRVYWGFVGNKYADWKNFIPTNRKFFREMLSVLKIDILLAKNKEHHSVGHNPLAGLVYFLTFIAFLMQAFTGFALYANMSTWWFAGLFSWVSPIVGGDFALRNWHHAAMWFFVLFSMVHVYLVFYHDYVEGRGEVSSMAGGWKFIDEEDFEKSENAKSE